jgi:hypothetical protein
MLELKKLETVTTNKNEVLGESKGRINLGNSCGKTVISYEAQFVILYLPFELMVSEIYSSVDSIIL